MSYSKIEVSDSDGKPTLLFEFQRSLLFFRYTDADQDIAVGGTTYAKAAIQTGTLSQSGDASADTLELTVPYDLAVCGQFDPVSPSEQVWLTIRRKHADADEAPIVWMGTVTGFGRPSVLTRKFVCDTISMSFSRGGLRLTWGRTCPNMLYDRNCKVDKTLYAFAGHGLRVDGVRIQVPEISAKAAGWFDGGFFEMEIASGVYERRGIEMTSGVTVRVFGSTAGFSDVPRAITLYPGCGRTIAICDGKFGNVLNYGGFVHLPGKSPFDGNPVF